MKTTPKQPLTQQHLVIIGMPGSGKSTIGRKLAARLGLTFVDSDQEVEAAAGMSVSQIFEKLGEPAFRDGERKVIARLLSQQPLVLSTGGGAFMNEATRGIIKAEALSIWLKVDLDVLVKRTSRTDDRPLLRGGDPAALLRALMEVREPVYALADITVMTDDSSIDETTKRVLSSLQSYQKTRAAP